MSKTECEKLIIEPISRQSGYDAFWTFLHGRYFQNREVRLFLEPRYPDETYADLENTLGSELVQQRLRTQWDYERGWTDEGEIRWEGRSVDEAVSETVGHTLENIHRDTDLYLYRDQRDVFKNATEAEVIALQKKIEILLEYIEYILANPDK